MQNMFFKFSYHNTDTWDGLIPPKGYDAKFYYHFAMLGKSNYTKKLKELHALWDKQIEEELYEYEYDSYYDYEMDDDEDDWLDIADKSGETTVRRRAEMTSQDFLNIIYSVHAAKELGYFLYDWTVLPESYVQKNDLYLKLLKRNQSITRFNDYYGVTYDGGKLMKDFLDFVKNNRNRDKCKMFFVYGGNDPWTGAAIPDPDPDDPYVKKYIVPRGLHSAWLNSPSHYTEQDRDYIMNTVRDMLK